MKKTWTFGVDNYRNCTLFIDGNTKTFTTSILDRNVEDTSIELVLLSHYEKANTKTIEILYSGGVDSELSLEICRKHKMPVVAITAKLYIKGMLCNTHDVYYATKYCINKNIKQKFIELELTDFFDSGDFLNYIEPFYITEPHVAVHFYLINQCQSFPVMGGDWLWVQNHNYIKDPVISPARLDYSCYDIFMEENGITGIGNMLGNSYSAVYKFAELFIKKYYDGQYISETKNNMYEEIIPIEKRFRSYGFERIPKDLLDIGKYKQFCIEKFKETTHIIEWGNNLSKLLNTTLHTNDKF
jgi:hypothetical protein